MLDFKVIEFVKEDKKIVLSHAATYAEEVVEKKGKGGAKKKTKEGDSAEINNSAATSTLGDLEALSSLKEQLDAAQK